MEMEDYALGFNPFFADHSKQDRRLRPDLCGLSVNIQDLPGQSLKLSKVLDRRTGIVSRATLVYRATLEGRRDAGDVVLKSSWQHHARRSEWYVLQQLHEDSRARDHIVVAYAGWEQENTSGAHRRAKFGTRASTVLDDRALRHTVLEYLNPITKLSDPWHVPYIGWSVLKAIQFLNEKRWYHRDISIGNMGFLTLPECRGVLVKLHDFDLSKNHGSSSETPHWTGTLPFMALGLLKHQESPHRLGYDVEALIWCLLWIVRVYDDGKPAFNELEDHPLRGWFRDWLSLHDLVDRKLAYLQPPTRRPFTNTFYRSLDGVMTHLAWTWAAPIREWNNLEPSESEGPETGDGGLANMYEDSRTVTLQTWMEERDWNRPRSPCSCGDHFADN
ncbi:hypothetical protein M407DRAFT_32278 [Tulasnella calospora MUT 4182]|uniref:Protein kinase domain-containing protein n=1 Tax=Tulasnella calospora MUT 4182 TaxID=1051891 RepID=A0A0C3Q492_9AGAM|nr:hypothetical protein M407DRAFT_32278 [Tulasnella calospora MUT 4182]